MTLRRIGTDQQHDIGLHHRSECLCAGGLAQRVLETVARGRMTHARARIDIVVAESRTHELLHEIRLFVRATRRGNAADGIASMLRLDTLELARGMADRLV